MHDRTPVSLSEDARRRKQPNWSSFILLTLLCALLASALALALKRQLVGSAAAVAIVLAVVVASIFLFAKRSP